MTKRLKQLSGNQFSVTVLNHSWQQPQQSEQEILSLEKSWGIGREVVLNGINQSWIYARSFFPESVVKAYGEELLELGQRPLGEILFNNPEVTRSDFSIASLLPEHLEYQVAANALKQAPQFFWARRSQFTLPGGVIVLMEVFSPLLERFLAESEQSSC